ncbi:hypothetical protein SAMN03097708_00703 [Thiohalomonas denitrificans]|uniref:Uncharacterized protein n=1 Tax=Thiohalomonas denitrificans TaxID=415747 RepID=A0A1G5PRM4_9GAMM|nr:hypothetical protein SAMN03097708_00703 [Thiohalomonas denitrificans]
MIIKRKIILSIGFQQEGHLEDKVRPSLLRVVNNRKPMPFFHGAGRLAQQKRVYQPSPWEQLKGQVYLGSETFVEKMQATRT